MASSDVVVTASQLPSGNAQQIQTGGFAAPTSNRVPGGASEIQHKSLRFLITERPNDVSMTAYLEDLRRFRVATVVRVCDPTYSTQKLAQAGIQVVDLSFPDGQPPPQEVIDRWLELVRSQASATPDQCVAVHCVAGLGRAPVLVAVALMELGMKYEDAVEMIRLKRHGALNSRQLQFLSRYKPKGRLKSVSTGNGSCVVA